MRYSLQRGSGLNFGKRRRGFLRNFVPKGKQANYYDKTRMGLGYVTPPPPTTFQSKDNKLILSRSASSSEWESDISVRMLFKNLSVSMTSISQLEHGEAIKTFDAESWAQQLDFQWEKQFKQREPPTEDKVVQVNLGSQGHPKTITINESLSLTEKEELIALVREYIDVFVWNYEDMPGVDP